MTSDEGRLDFYPSLAPGSTKVLDIDGCFTHQNVFTVLREIKGWDYWWSYNRIQWKWVGGALLYITTVKMDHIAATSPSTMSDDEGLKKVIRVWMETCPYASWRWLVWRMDNEHPYQGNVHYLADFIRRFVEPSTETNDPSLTMANVFEILNDVMFVTNSLKLPSVVKNVIRPIGTTRKRSRESLVSSWLAAPFASWEMLAGGLYAYDETNALECLQNKQCLKIVTDPTFTFSNVWGVLKDFQFSPELLDLPESVTEDPEILSDNTSSSGVESTMATVDTLKKYVEYYLTHHPAPSWYQLAYNLYTKSEYYWYEKTQELKVYEVLKVIKTKYLEELKLQKLCIQVIVSSLNSTGDVDSLPLPDCIKERIKNSRSL